MTFTDSARVHVWQARLESAEPGRTILSADELARAGRLLGDEPRRRFIAARGFLRSLLGRYLGVEPSRLEFGYGPHGKPELIDHPLRFNLAHSQDLAMAAVTQDTELGIDVEVIRPLPEMAELAQRYFSVREADRLLRLPEEDRLEAFFRCWVRKEAYLKGLGQGLSLRADQVETWPDPPPTGSLVDLTPAAGFVAALALERADLTVACWQWPAECG